MKSLLVTLIAIVTLSSCALLDPPGCELDMECRAPRVCSFGECVDPSEINGPSTSSGVEDDVGQCNETVLDCNCQYTDAYDGQSFYTDACDSSYAVVTTYGCQQQCYEFPTWQVVCGC